MAFSSRDLFQINATILAGLLILLTIETIHSNPFEEMFLQFVNSDEQLESEEEKITKLLDYYNFSDSNIISDSELHKNLLPKEIRLHEIQIERELLLNKTDDLMKYNNFVFTKTIWKNIYSSLVMLLMIIPFIFSILIEISHVYKTNESNTNASNLAIVFLMFGLVSLAIGIILLKF